MNRSRSVITRTTHNVIKKLLIIPIVFSSLHVIMFVIKTYKLDSYIFGGHAIDAASSSATATNKRWAVMMIGGARTYAFTHQSFLWNVVNQTDPPMDVFVSTQYTNSCSVDKLSSVLLEMDSKAWRYHDIIDPGLRL
jgi:3-methyladenine DNA glycosylase Mpg